MIKEPVIMENKMGFNLFLMFVTFQFRGLHHLELYCTIFPLKRDLN